MTKKKGKKAVVSAKDAAGPSGGESNSSATNSQAPQYRFGDIAESDNLDEESKLDANLTALGLARKKIPKDGACLFRAVAEQLYYTQTMHHSVRRKCVDYIEKHKDMYEPFVCGDMPYDHYCFEMRKSNTWGGEVEISAMHYTFGLDFEIFSPTHADPTRVGDGKHHRIKLGFYGNHYDCVYPQKRLDCEELCQGLVYDIIDKALGVKLPRDTNFRNVGLECWARELEEQQRRDLNMAAELTDSEHNASSRLSGFSKKSPENGNGWQTKNRRQGAKAHAADDASGGHGQLNNSGSVKRQVGAKSPANGKPAARASSDESEDQFMQDAIRAVSEQERREKENQRVLMMRDQTNFPSLSSPAKPAWKPLPTPQAAAAAAAAPSGAAAASDTASPPPPPPAVAAQAPSAAAGAATSATAAAPLSAPPSASASAQPADKPGPGVWSAQPRSWSALFNKPAAAAAPPAAYRPPMTASSESAPVPAPAAAGADASAAAATEPSSTPASASAPLNASAAVSSAAPAVGLAAAPRPAEHGERTQKLGGSSAGEPLARSGHIERVMSLKEVVVDPFSPPAVRKAPSPVTVDPAIVRVYSAADYAALPTLDESSPVRFAFDGSNHHVAASLEPAPVVQSTLEPPTRRSASVNDFQLPELVRSPVRLSSNLLLSFGQIPPPEDLVIGSFRIVAASIWPFKRSASPEATHPQSAASPPSATSSVESAYVPSLGPSVSGASTELVDEQPQQHVSSDLVSVAAASEPLGRTQLSATSPSFDMPPVYQEPVFAVMPHDLAMPYPPGGPNYEPDSYEAVQDQHYRTTALRPPYGGDDRRALPPFAGAMQNGFAPPGYMVATFPQNFPQTFTAPPYGVYYADAGMPWYSAAATYPPLYNPTGFGSGGPSAQKSNFPPRGRKNAFTPMP